MWQWILGIYLALAMPAFVIFWTALVAAKRHDRDMELENQDRISHEVSVPVSERKNTNDVSAHFPQRKTDRFLNLIQRRDHHLLKRAVVFLAIVVALIISVELTHWHGWVM